MPNTISKAVITLADGTKVLQVIQQIDTPNGQRQINSSQPRTAEQLQRQIDALQADLALFDAPTVESTPVADGALAEVAAQIVGALAGG